MISNPRASKAIYRLMMLVRMKLRNTAAGAWREKWLRAKRRVKGILNIQSIVKRERIERIERMYKPTEEESMGASEMDEVMDSIAELDKSDIMNTTMPKGVTSLTGQLRSSALAGKAAANNSMINTQNRPSNVSRNFISSIFAYSMMRVCPFVCSYRKGAPCNL